MDDERDAFLALVGGLDSGKGGEQPMVSERGAAALRSGCSGVRHLQGVELVRIVFQPLEQLPAEAPLQVALLVRFLALRVAKTVRLYYCLFDGMRNKRCVQTGC